MAGAPRRRTFEQRLKDLEHLVGQFQRAARLRSASIGAGGLRIRDGGSIITEYDSGRKAFIFGNLGAAHPVFEDVTGMLLLKDDEAGTFIFSLYDEYPGIVDSVLNIQNVEFIILEGNQACSMTASPNSILVTDTGGVNLDGTTGGVGCTGELTAFDGFRVNNYIEYFSPPTSAAAANVRYDSGDARLKHITSSERFKQDIEDAEVDPLALLRVHGVTWRDKQEVVKDSTVTTRYVGFTAEAFHEAGLTDFVEYDDEGLPFALQYDRISVALLELDRYQQTRIDGLEQRHRQQEQKINELESRLAALEVALAEKEA